MNILLLTDNLLGVIGGTNDYVKNILKYIQNTDNNIVFIYPSTIDKSLHRTDNIIYFPIKIDSSLKYRDMLDIYMHIINTKLEQILSEYNIQIFHLLSGFLIIDKIDFNMLEKYNIKSFVTIHNIPPKECSKSWYGDNLFLFSFDQMRKVFINLRSYYILNKCRYTAFIVNSDYVAEILNKYRKKSIENTYIIKLGTNKQYHNNYCKYIQNNKIHILTVGGIVPHKNQLLIAKAGKLLKMRGINYEWKIIGPIRNYRYYNRVINYIKENNLDQNITLVTKADDLYIDQSNQSANIYVQPSKEEGFCIAALDAAMYGIPIIGTDVGEIANLVNMTNGILVKTNEEDIAKAVEKIIKRANINGDYKNALSREYSWQTNVNNLIRLYRNSLSETTDK